MTFLKKLRRPSLSKGFTLVELLVVIAIIGVLSTLLLLQLNVARAKARDAKRVADINQVRSAIELFYDDNGHYPIWSEMSTYTQAQLKLNKYLVKVPLDPGNGCISDAGFTGPNNGTIQCYAYADSPVTNPVNPTKFHLWAELEQKATTALANDLDFNSTNTTDWPTAEGKIINASTAATENCTSSTAVDCIYDLGQPN